MRLHSVSEEKKMSVEVTGINKPAEIDRKENLREECLKKKALKWLSM